jgi:hypothetical protein
MIANVKTSEDFVLRLAGELRPDDVRLRPELRELLAADRIRSPMPARRLRTSSYV